MSYQNFVTKLKRINHRLNGSTIEYNLDYYSSMLDKINSLEFELTQKSDFELKALSQLLIEQARAGTTLDELLVDAFALVREASFRALKIRPFDVQIIGGIALHQGKLAEMQTGEGKTLAAVFPAYLNALMGKGVHILTFNDYLARRDALWMGPIFEFLGLRVGFVQEGMPVKERQHAYAADITYLTAKEAGFDYLRDCLAYEQSDLVHRPFNFAIIDEADSILIDEARIPLVIAESSEDYVADCFRIAGFAKKLKQDIDFHGDEYSRNIHLTELGLERTEKFFRVKNLYAEKNIELLTRINCAIHAEYLFQRDVDYIVRNGKIELVDEFTGRVADKRRWPDGLQAALEAKENLARQSRGKILNSITLQHFLKMYLKIAGMTATAQSAGDEFQQFYGLPIVVIPPNKSCIRVDHSDAIFRTKSEKNLAIIKEIIKVHRGNRPILVGTCSVAESTCLASILEKLGIPNHVLNAKNDAHEAAIIAGAGQVGAVTISTNMAGRGTDIRLGGPDEKNKQQVVATGGLYVIGTNKHESARIDNQLRGRAGRQGDPGSSRFFISLDDDLFVRYKIRELFPVNFFEKNNAQSINHSIVRNEINRLQRIIEGQNLEIKKTLFKYSIIIEEQRKIVFERRLNALQSDSVLDMFEAGAAFKNKILKTNTDIENLNSISKKILLYYTDFFWSQYLSEIEDIREGIHLESICGKAPFFEFLKIAIARFEDSQKEFNQKIAQIFEELQISENGKSLDELGIKAPSATWTYLINDNPFQNQLGVNLLGNIGLSAGASLIMTPFLAFYPILQRLARKRKQRA